MASWPLGAYRNVSYPPIALVVDSPVQPALNAWFAGPIVFSNSIAFGAIRGGAFGALEPSGNVNGRFKPVPESSRKFNVAEVATVPRFTNAKVVCQPLPAAKCA